MKKTIQELKAKIESIKKTQTERNMEIKKFRNLNRNLKGKPHQQNTENGRENY